MLNEDNKGIRPGRPRRATSRETDFHGEGLPLHTLYMKKYAGVYGEGQFSMVCEGQRDRRAEQRPRPTAYGIRTSTAVTPDPPDLYGACLSSNLAFKGFDFSITFNYKIWVARPSTTVTRH